MISTNVSPCDVKRESSKELIVQEERGTECPPWFTTGNSANDSNCTCLRSLPSIVTCTPSRLSIELCHCMTVDLQTKITVVGSCPFSCLTPMQWFSEPTTLNFHMCGLRYHRTGQLCAQCQSGSGPLVYSYSRMYFMLLFRFEGGIAVPISRIFASDGFLFHYDLLQNLYC